MTEVHLEQLIGRAVHDANGRRIGRVAEAVAHDVDGEIVVMAYLVGPAGWLARFALHGLGLRWRSLAAVYRVAWDQMDLSDPGRPQVTCARDDLVVEHVPPRKRGLTRRPGRNMK
jgi:sporulation protein YlmC with PRC-barrel domain